jgi:hypothetical protein
VVAIMIIVTKRQMTLMRANLLKFIY